MGVCTCVSIICFRSPLYRSAWCVFVLVYLSFVPALPCTDLSGGCLYLFIYHLFPLSPVQICLVGVVLVYLSIVPALPCTDLSGGCLYLCINHLFPLSPVQICLVGVCTCVSIICSRSPQYRTVWWVFVRVYLSFVPALPCTDLSGGCLYLCIYHLFPLFPVQICLVGVCTCVSIICSRSPLYRSGWCVFVLVYLSFVPALPCTYLSTGCLNLCIYHLFPLSPVQICLVGVCTCVSIICSRSPLYRSVWWVFVLVYLSFVPALPCTDLSSGCLYLCIYHLFPLSPVQICLVGVCTCVSIICSRSPLYRSGWCVFVLVYLSFVPALPSTDLPGVCLYLCIYHLFPLSPVQICLVGVCTCVSIICSRSPQYRSVWWVFVLVYLSFVPALPCTDLPGVCFYLCIYHLFPLSPVQICLVGVCTCVSIICPLSPVQICLVCVCTCVSIICSRSPLYRSAWCVFVRVYLLFVPALPCTDLPGVCLYLCIYHLFPLSPVQICLVGVCTCVSIICSRSPLYRAAWCVFVRVYISFVPALPCTDLPGGCLYLCIYHLFPLSPVQICLVGVCTCVSIICSRSPLYRSAWCVFVLVYLSFVPALPCTDLPGGCLYLCIYHLLLLSPVQICLVGVCTCVSIICSRSPLYRSFWWVFVLVYLSFVPALPCTDLSGGCLYLCIYHLFPLSPVQICLVGVCTCVSIICSRSPLYRSVWWVFVLVYLSFVPALPSTDLSGRCLYLCIYHLFPLSPGQICLLCVCTCVSIICSRSPQYRSVWWVFVLVYLSFVLALPCTDLAGGCLYSCIYHLFPLSPVQIWLLGVCTRVSIICSRSPLYRLSGGCLYLCIYHLFPLSPVQICLVCVCTCVSIICSRFLLYRSVWWVFVLVYLSFVPALPCTDLAGGCLI